MNRSSFVITPRVVNTIKSLPESIRGAIANALVSEMLLDQSPEEHLTPVQMMVYVMIRNYVERDSRTACPA